MNITDIIKPFFERRWDRLDRFAESGEDISRNELRKLLHQAKDTEIGKLYNFKDIDGNYTKFSERVPIIDYEGVKPYVQRMLNGEQNLIWSSDIKWFAKSSGTTNDKSKFIPVSYDAMRDCHYNGGRDTLSMYFRLNPQSNIFAGKSLILGGSHQISNLKGECSCGDLSAVLIENIPHWFNIFRSPSKSVALMAEWEEKLEKICNTTVTQNITNLSGVPSWFLVLIKKVIAKSEKSNLAEVWPNLEVFFHGGIGFEPYREQYNQLIPIAGMRYLETYNASEGYFAAQNSFDEKSLLLLIDLGIFFEFIPISDMLSDNPKVYPYWGVEKGENYALVITTNSGLWRYKIGDTVRVASTNPLKITISGRIKHYINAFGEELMVDNADKGIRKACAATNTSVANYSAAPVFMSNKSKGRHQWLIEFDTLPSSIDKFAEILDKSLQEINSDYEAKRYKGIALDRLEIIAAKRGLFDHWLKRKGKLGGQHKIPRLCNTREYIDEMIELNNNL